MSNNITPGHVTAFQIVRSYDNITLTSCTINDEPGVAIVAVDQAKNGKVAVMPLFVALTPNMKVDFAGEAGSEDADEPTREDAKSEVTLHWRDATRR
jgi:hypothetical protein